jgi:hypothetical protein
MITEVYLSLRARELVTGGPRDAGVYEWMMANEKLTAWLNQNIGQKTSWSVQTIEGQINVHTDWSHPDTKLNYLVDCGGENISTRWYHDGKEITNFVCQPHMWYALQVRIPHDVGLVAPGRYRISVTHGYEHAISK